MGRRKLLGIVAVGILIVAGSVQSQERAKTLYIFRYGLPSNQITQGILLEFYCDGLLKRAEVREIDHLTIEQAQAADFGLFSLVSEAQVVRAGGTITIEVSDVEDDEQVVWTLDAQDESTIEILIPDRPDDRAEVVIEGGRSTYFFNDREISSLEVSNENFIRRTRRLVFEYSRDFANGEIGRVFWTGIGEVTAITNDKTLRQLEFEYIEDAVPYWYRLVYSGMAPQMSFRTAVLTDFLVMYGVPNALFQQLFPLIAASVQ